MNELISAFFWICIFLCGQFFEDALAQKSEEWQAFMDEGAYRAASVEAERIYFEAETSHERAQAALARSWALKHLGEHQQARENLRRVSMRNLSPELEFRIHYERTLLHYLEGEFNDARNSLEQLRHFVDKPEWQDLAEYLEILSLIELNRWDDAYSATEDYLESIEASFSADSVFKQDPPRLRDPDRAEILSSFLPGAGLIYAGKPGGGLGNAAIQISALGWGVYNVLSGYYLTALFSGGGLFQAFYFGGIERAGVVANRHNEEETINYNAELTESLLRQIEPYLNKKRRTLKDSPFDIKQ